MRNLFTILVAFLLGHISAICSTAIAVNNVTQQSRAAETCADPTLATVYIDAFSPSRTAHVIRAKLDMVVYDSDVGGSDNWQFQGPSFLAWLNPQEFTVPFYQLVDSTGSNFLFLPAVNGIPPTASGYSTEVIVGYAYATQICGSVPLLSASNAASSDYWWTTSASDHATMLAKGYVDAGIPFYVLPLGMSFPTYLEFQVRTRADCRQIVPALTELVLDLPVPAR